jgi:hypothetical protein
VSTLHGSGWPPNGPSCKGVHVVVAWVRSCSHGVDDRSCYDKRVPYGPPCVHDNAYSAPDSFKEGDPKRIHRPDFTEQYMGMCSDDIVNTLFTDGHGRCGLGFLLRTIKEPFRRFIVHDVWYPRGDKPFGGFREDVLRRLSQRIRPTGFHFVFQHIGQTPHLHSVHDCAYSNR